jgi:lipooligosaccharide transport system permease protein
VFLGVMLAMPDTRAPSAILCVPVAVLTGLAFATVFMAIAGIAPNGYTYDVVSRVVIVPLFMFGGVFFPVDRLPAIVRWVVELTPIAPGTELARTALAGGPVHGVDVLHLGVLLVYFVGGFLLAHKAFRGRLRR